MRSPAPVQMFYTAHAHRGQSSPAYSVAFDQSNLYVALDQCLNLLGRTMNMSMLFLVMIFLGEKIAFKQFTGFKHIIQGDCGGLTLLSGILGCLTGNGLGLTDQNRPNQIKDNETQCPNHHGHSVFRNSNSIEFTPPPPTELWQPRRHQHPTGEGSQQPQEVQTLQQEAQEQSPS